MNENDVLFTNFQQEVRRTRSGRIVFPPLADWAGERIVSNVRRDSSKYVAASNLEKNQTLYLLPCSMQLRYKRQSISSVKQERSGEKVIHCKKYSEKQVKKETPEENSDPIASFFELDYKEKFSSKKVKAKPKHYKFDNSVTTARRSNATKSNSVGKSLNIKKNADELSFLIEENPKLKETCHVVLKKIDVKKIPLKSSITSNSCRFVGLDTKKGKSAGKSLRSNVKKNNADELSLLVEKNPKLKKACCVVLEKIDLKKISLKPSVTANSCNFEGLETKKGNSIHTSLNICDQDNLRMKKRTKVKQSKHIPLFSRTEPCFQNLQVNQDRKLNENSSLKSEMLIPVKGRRNRNVSSSNEIMSQTADDSGIKSEDTENANISSDVNNRSSCRTSFSIPNMNEIIAINKSYVDKKKKGLLSPSKKSISKVSQVADMKHQTVDNTVRSLKRRSCKVIPVSSSNVVSAVLPEGRRVTGKTFSNAIKRHSLSPRQEKLLRCPISTAKVSDIPPSSRFSMRETVNNQRQTSQRNKECEEICFMLPTISEDIKFAITPTSSHRRLKKSLKQNGYQTKLIKSEKSDTVKNSSCFGDKITPPGKSSYIRRSKRLQPDRNHHFDIDSVNVSSRAGQSSSLKTLSKDKNALTQTKSRNETNLTKSLFSNHSQMENDVTEKKYIDSISTPKKSLIQVHYCYSPKGMKRGQYQDSLTKKMHNSSPICILHVDSHSRTIKEDCLLPNKTKGKKHLDKSDTKYDKASYNERTCRKTKLASQKSIAVSKSASISSTPRKAVPKAKNKITLSKQSKKPIKVKHPQAILSSKKGSLNVTDKKNKHIRKTNQILADGAKEPTKGSMKRKQWFFDKLNQQSEGHEDDIFESKQFEIVPHMFEGDSDSSDTYSHLPTPRRNCIFIPHSAVKAPVFEIYPSPSEFNVNRKSADEYLYRRKKRQKLKHITDKPQPEPQISEAKKELNRLKAIEETNKMLEKLRKQEKASNFIKNEDLDDYYFSGASDDSSNDAYV